MAPMRRMIEPRPMGEIGFIFMPYCI